MATHDELVLFGGLRNRNELSAGQLQASPAAQHTITNETYILRPIVDF